MNTTHLTQPLLKSLQTRLEAIDGVRTDADSNSEISVEYKGRRVGSWTPNGQGLQGQFACEGAILCADTAEEACHLTIGRLD
jgi:hypothetical protein